MWVLNGDVRTGWYSRETWRRGAPGRRVRRSANLQGVPRRQLSYILPASPTFHCVTTLSQRMVPPSRRDSVMRASLYLIGFAAASIVGAGIVQIGCSSSSTPTSATPPADASTPGTDAPVAAEDGGGEAAAPCVDMAAGMKGSTIDGGATWACYQTACATSITACSNSCACNNAVIGALQCSEPDAAALATGCFTTALGTLATSDPTDEMPLGSCLTGNSCCMTGTCGSDGGAGDSGTAADTGTTADAGAADAADGG